ncbi:MAG TPA: pyrimidine reductase family protein [Mycobacteriales bacterium]
MRRLHPGGGPAADLTDDDLLAAYAVPPGTGRHVRANFVSSADGAVTLDGVSGGLSSPADKRVFGLLRDLADVVLVGAGTVRTENYGYPTYGERRRSRRRELGLAELPAFAVVSGSLALDPRSRFFREAQVRPLVVTAAAAVAKADELAGVAELLPAGGDALDLLTALDLLAGRGLRRVLCEGGPTVFGQLAAAGALDELCLTLSPVLAGAGPARISAGPPHPPLGMTLRHVLTEEGALFLRYAAVHPGEEQAG